MERRPSSPTTQPPPANLDSKDNGEGLIVEESKDDHFEDGLDAKALGELELAGLNDGWDNLDLDSEGENESDDAVKEIEQIKAIERREAEERSKDAEASPVSGPPMMAHVPNSFPRRLSKFWTVLSSIVRALWLEAMATPLTADFKSDSIHFSWTICLSLRLYTPEAITSTFGRLEMLKACTLYIGAGLVYKERGKETSKKGKYI